MLLLRGAQVSIRFRVQDRRRGAFGSRAPITGAARALFLLVPLTLAGCAVGPDFLAPSAPSFADFTAGARLPATESSAVADGEAQKFLKGRDIPGEWWKVFHSRQLDELVSAAIAANPSLQAAQATLWQAQENLY